MFEDLVMMVEEQVRDRELSVEYSCKTIFIKDMGIVIGIIGSAGECSLLIKSNYQEYNELMDGISFLAEELGHNVKMRMYPL